MDPGLQAKAVFEELQRRHPGQLQSGQLRTLQRRFRAWRTRQGPDKEVYFDQEREPGAQCQSDFTAMGKLGVTIGGVPFKHLVYRFVLPYSNWEHVTIASSETFEALVGGLQESLWALGGVPREHRTDNLSAATHELRQSGGRACNRAYADFLAQYGLEASRNYPGNAHENGDVESAHGHFKTALEQRLRLSGTRDFGSMEQYLRVLEELAEQRNSRRGERLATERAALRALPSRTPAGVPGRAAHGDARQRGACGQQGVLGTVAADWGTAGGAAVRRSGRTGAMAGNWWSGTSGRWASSWGAWITGTSCIRCYASRERSHSTATAKRCSRRRPSGKRTTSSARSACSATRIWNTCAFCTWRRTTLQTRVETALQACLEAGKRPLFEQVRAAAAPPRPELPQALALRIAEPDLAVYDQLLAGRRESS